MKILLGLMLCFWGIKKCLESISQRKLLKKFLNGPQPIMVRISNKAHKFQKRHIFFQLDDNVAELCFWGEVLIDGTSYKATIITSPQKNIGETYILNGYFYPTSQLFIENRCDIYGYKIRKYSIPYLFPKAIMHIKPSNT